MGRKSALILGLVFSLSTSLWSQNEDAWQKVKNIAEKNLVTIEYYEEINSTESISQINKIKRSLSGVIVDSSGLIMTSAAIYKAKLDFSRSSHYGPAHPPKDIKIKLAGGKSVNAVFVGKDDDKNIAFIKANKPLDSNGLKFFTQSDNFIGQKIFVVYQLKEKYNFQLMVLEKSINSIIPGPPKKMLTDIGTQSIKFGLVFDKTGSNLGIIYQVSSASSMPYNYSSRQAGFGEILTPESFNALIADPPKFKKKNTDRKKWLGVNMQPFTRSLASYFNEDDLTGILISTILEGSPAEKAGLKIGDVLTEFNGTKLQAEKNTDLATLRNLIRESDDETVNVKIWRKGSIKSLKINLSTVPISQYLADEISNERLGFSAKELTKDIIMAKQLEYDTDGVWVSRVERAGWADLSGLHVGDLLLKVDDQDLQSISQLDTFLGRLEKEKPAYISFFVKRHSETRFLFIKTNFD
ncbi:MAG: PDZ domain-containing protein [Calditrichaeota bacterium]|nr:PDZ domain-containing protein [Calditrichota bacterium]